jgi:hypothetical protein
MDLFFFIVLVMQQQTSQKMLRHLVDCQSWMHGAVYVFHSDDFCFPDKTGEDLKKAITRFEHQRFLSSTYERLCQKKN